MTWEILKAPGSSEELSSGNLAIHAALVATTAGPAIFYFDGVFGEEGARLFDITTRNVLPDPDSAPFPTPGSHIFCSGHALLADGRWLVAGGVVNQNVPHGTATGHDSGEHRCYLYHPLVGQWEQIQDLNFQPGSEANPRGGGRWYPTLVTLADGQVLATGGHPFSGKALGNGMFDLTGADDYVFPGDNSHRHNNNTAERYSGGKWVQLTAASTSHNNFDIDEYPRVHLAPNGRVFYSTIAAGNKRFYSAYSGTYNSTDVNPSGDSGYFAGSEPTSILMPLLSKDLDQVWVLACGRATPQRINIASNTPKWDNAGTRDQWVDPGIGGNAISPGRTHGCAVVLPTGDIFVTGGVGPANNTFPQGTSTRVPEIYEPPINWAQGKYTSEKGKWTALTNDPATVVRGYHSVALLLPDGSVWTAGSTDSSGGDTVADGTDDNGDPTFAAKNEFRMEVYKPAYFDSTLQSLRPVLTNVPKNIGYANTFRFNTQANSIQRVVVTRCGSVTHGFDSDQRLVQLEFKRINSTTIEIQVPFMPERMPPGRYLLWAINELNLPCLEAKMIRISKQKAVFSVEYDKYAKSEVDALGTPATFSSALFLIYDGFLPDEVTAPSRTIVWKGGSDDGNTVPGITTTLGNPKYEGGFANKDVAQRIVYPVHVTFNETGNNQTVFDSIPDNPGFRDITLKAVMGNFATNVGLSLTKKLNPRMSDGDPPWLSLDLRSFSVRDEATPFTAGRAHPGTAAQARQYITSLLQDYDSWNNTNPGQSHPFDSLPRDQAHHLPVYSHETVNGTDYPVYNFAIARVRFRAPVDVTTPQNVRVFFRLWTTGWTSLDYSTDNQWGSYPRDGNGDTAAPRLGLYGGEVNTIPCFAEAREATMSNQKDPANLKKLVGIGADEVYTYFGCFLDNNQDVKLFPLEPDPNDAGPYTSGLKSITEIMRGLHQCLVAEIHYWPDDEIPKSATPTSSDNLSQRNILFDAAANPGSFATHLVHHTFEMKPSPVPLAAPDGSAPATLAGMARLHPDELIIDWGNLPRESHVTFYWPQLDVDSILSYAARRAGPGNIATAGAHTVRCKVTDVGFIPIPGPMTKSIAGLVSVQLPPNITKGQKFSFVLRQVDGRKLRVVGTTQFDIHVKTAPEIIPGLKRNLSVLKHIALSIPASNRWYPVFERYLDEMGERLRGFGVDPNDIGADPTGNGKPVGGDRPDDENRHDSRTGKVSALLYDCFGEFEGFTLKLDDCENRVQFRSCGKDLEEVVRRACRKRQRVTVYFAKKSRNKVLRIAVHCC